MYINYEEYKAEYQKLWDTMHVVRDGVEHQRVSDKIFKFKDIYQKVEKETGVPWQMIAVIHLREAGEQDIGRWLCCLHDGEKIIGTGRKTRDVPAGRGPFETWHEAALDALRIQGFDKVKTWPVSRMLWALEPYNGYGYRHKGLRSPYLWASTNHQQSGKYISDGVFDAGTMDTQVGCAAVLKYLGVGAKSAMPEVTTTGTILVGAGTAAAYFPDLIVPIIVGSVFIAGMAYLIYRNRKNK